MPRSICIFALLFFSLIVLNSCTSPSLTDAQALGNEQSASTGISKGQTPPDFIIKTIDGKEIRLSEFKGNKPVLLYFWASWCPYCKQDLGIAKDIFPNYADKAAFIAIDLDLNENADLIRKYKEKMGLRNIEFAEGNKRILSDYSIIYTTTKYAIGKNGEIIYKGSGVFTKEQWEVLLNGLATSN